MELSPDQQAARVAVLDALQSGARELVLSGPAGSGKTTLMRTLLADLDGAGRQVVLLAPTGKAAARLRDLTGRDTSTIHRPLYKRVIERPDGGVEFEGAKAVAGGRAVVVCDEASMIGSRLYGDLLTRLPASVQLLCVGDREQLPPVNDTWGAAFESPTALLTAVHRQAEGSPIIRLATAIRQGAPWSQIQPDGVAYSREAATIDQVAGWAALQRALGVDCTLLTFSNRTRQALNLATRAARGFTDPLHRGDVIVCTRNSHDLGLFNGETRTIADFGYTVLDRVVVDNDSWDVDLEPWRDVAAVDWLEGGSAWLLDDTLDGGPAPSLWREIQDHAERDQRKRLIMAEYGECLTVHKSQGSQWDTVALVHDRALDGLAGKEPDTYRRLMYTAVTRAAKSLVIFEV